MIIADLHVHSRFARGCSKDLTVQNLEKWARVKGLDLLGTGDFTHPEWFKELKSELEDDGSGVLRTKKGFPFILQVEISQIYSFNGKGRRIHNIILAPGFEVGEQVVDYFKSKGRVDYDGRPIFNLSCPELVEDLRSISKDLEVIPAHVWTPWFSLFGSKSGFDSVEEAFQDQARHIHALETGLSSDPAMNWMISKLDKYNLVSFSDAHSYWPWRLGREATVFNLERLSYKQVLTAIRTGKGIYETVEVDPAYGKYHFDGHRACNVHLSPEEAEQLRNKCPVCGKPLTLGVLHRVKELADREPAKPPGKPGFKRLLPLSEVLAHVLGGGVNSKKVWSHYWKLVKAFGNEFNALLKAGVEELEAVAGLEVAEAVMDNRAGELRVVPGYDGVYGSVEAAEEPGKFKGQKALGEFFKQGP